MADVLAIIEITDERFWEAELYRIKAMLLLREASTEAELIWQSTCPPATII